MQHSALLGGAFFLPFSCFASSTKLIDLETAQPAATAIQYAYHRCNSGIKSKKEVSATTEKLAQQQLVASSDRRQPFAPASRLARRLAAGSFSNREIPSVLLLLASGSLFLCTSSSSFCWKCSPGHAGSLVPEKKGKNNNVQNPSCSL